MGVVREDVVKMGFDIDFAELTRLTSALDDIKDILTSGIGGDAFDEMTKEGKRAAKVVKDIAGCTEGIKPDGIQDTVRGLKDTEEEGEDAYKQLKKIADAKFDKTVSGLKKLTSTLGKVGIEAGKILAKGIAVGVAGVGVIVGKAIMEYADYEQLVGGVETLFGDSAGTVQKYADEAWSAAGLSANDYMQTVVGFSASLIQSLGGNTGAAAEYANMAIIDMADNANKMGTDMNAIMDAYRGFAKQNFTMLDNLALGYGGTKEEMARLLADATALTGIKYDINSYADIVAAIHAIQESMGITGTTAAEASDTIAGSFSAMKAAWGNTLTSLILGGDDFDRSIDNLVDSAKTFAKNIMPALGKALTGVGSMIEETAPIIERELPGFIDALLPSMIRAAGSLLKALIKALPSIVSTIIDEAPDLLKQVWEGIREVLGDVPGIDKVEAFFGKLKTFFEDNADTIKKFVPTVLILIGAFKLLNKLKGLTGLFGGGKGGAGDGFFGSLSKMKPTTVLKGILNLSIIIGALMGLSAILMAAAPYMAKLSDLKSIAEVLFVMTVVGLLGTAMTKLAAKVGNIPVATVSKGVANIAITLVSFGALAAVLMWLAPNMAAMSDMKSVFEVVLVIGIVGIIGTALTKLASFVGNIPVATVTKGVTNIAITLVTFGALAAVLMWLAPYMAAMSDMQSIGEVVLVIGIVGVLGTALSALAGLVGNIPVATVTKGVTNIAITLVAFGALASVLMWLAPSLAALSDMQSILKVVLVIGITGVLGTALSALAGLIGMIPVATVLTGVANIAIALVGFGALASVLMWLAPSIAQLSDMSTFFKVLIIIGATGVVGSALAALAGLIGAIPITAVLTGLANIALALGGFTAIVEAFGALTLISGFSEFLSKGGEVLTQICGILGQMVGAVVGGFAEGVTDSLPAIGTNISSFATNVSTGITTLSSLNFEGLSNFATSFGAFMLVMAGEEILSWFTGGVDYSKLGTQLSDMATNLSGFFTNIAGFDETSFAKATALFECLAGVSSLPEEGGVVGWFMGEIDYAKMATGLNQLAGTAASFTAIQAIPEDAFTKVSLLFETLAGVKALPEEGGIAQWFTGTISYESIATGLQQLTSAEMIAAYTAIANIPAATHTGITTLFETLAGVTALPKEGGIAQWFTGTIAYDSIATGLQQLTSPEMLAAYTAIANIPATAYTGITTLFDTLAGVSEIPKSGGIAQWFTGDSTKTIDAIGEKLPALGSNIGAFFTNVGGRTDFTPIKTLFDTLANIEIDTDAASKGFLGLGTSDLEKIGTGLSNFATKASTFFTKINSLKSENLTSFFTALSTAGELPDTLSTINDTVGTQLSSLVTTADTKLAELYMKFSDELGSIVLLMNTTATAMYNSGVAMMTGVNNGMESMRATLIATASSIAAAVQAAYDAKLDINSPSRVMMTSGEDTVMGGVIGMRNRIPDMRAAATDVATAATPAFTRTYNPDTDSGTVYNSRTSNVDHTTISPSFNLHISGTQDDRATARKVRQWVREAMQESFDSMGRKTSDPREA